MPALLKRYLLGLGVGACGIFGREGTFIIVEAPRPDLPEDLSLPPPKTPGAILEDTGGPNP